MPCANAFRELSGNVTLMYHSEPRLGGCANFACQLRLALHVFSDITRLAHFGLTSTNGLPLTDPSVRLLRFCGPDGIKKQRDDQMKAPYSQKLALSTFVIFFVLFCSC